MTRHAAAAAVAAILIAVPAAAQERATGTSADRSETAFEALTKKATPKDTLYVRDSDGRDTRGKFLRVSPSSITLEVLGSEREFSSDSVTRIARRGDTILDGTAAGAAVAGAVGLVGMLVTQCPAKFDSGSCWGAFGMMTGIGAGAGALVDFLVKGNTVIYRTRSGSTASVTPLVGATGAGLGVSLRF